MTYAEPNCVTINGKRSTHFYSIIYQNYDRILVDFGGNDDGNFIRAKQCAQLRMRSTRGCDRPTEMRPFHKYPFAPLVNFFYKEMIMSQNAPQRLYLMQVGSMPEYQIPIVCYLVQTGDGRNILIDSGLPEIMPEGETEFENGLDVIEQLARLGLKPDDIDTVISTHYDGDHAGRHAAFTKAQYVVQRVHHLDAASNPRFAVIRSQWDQPMERIRLVDGDTELLPGLELIETSGHVPGHQSVLVRLPKTGAVLLTIDAVPFADGFTRDGQAGSNPDDEAVRASTIKLLDLVEREHIGLVIFGHDKEQWETFKKAPEFYE